MEKQDQKPDQREYTIKIIPQQGETVRSIRLPIRTVKFAIASLCLGVLLFIGTFGYASYCMYTGERDKVEIGELRQVTNMQQEQLLLLAKKASALQSQMDEINELETAIRQMSNTDGAAAPGAGSLHDGQGGPRIQPNIENVSVALADIEKNMALRKQSLENLHQQLAVKQAEMAATPSVWPASGDVSSSYGLRWGGTDFHPGIDIANDIGTPIIATADGVVTSAGWNSGGYGNMVDIDHGNGIMTRYGHAVRVAVNVGQEIKRGQVIAYMGSTGFSTGPHLHYEVRINGQPVNPARYL